MPLPLEAMIEQAIGKRVHFLKRFEEEGTSCFRLFHGVAEGLPGLTVDRYGPLLLVQTRSDVSNLLTTEHIERIARCVNHALGDKLLPVWNKRGAPPHAQPPFDQPGPFVGQELKLFYDVRPRHRGKDPLLFLDFRSVRRWILRNSKDRSVLNLFAYTCGVGMCAARGGAREVWNVDFSKSALEVAQTNAQMNGIEITERYRLIRADVIPTLWQLAGLPVKGRASRREYVRFAPRSFDLVVLDPPRWAKTPFGAVDVVRDYPTLLKPAMRTIAPSGILIASNHVPECSRQEFERVIRRTAQKVGRQITRFEWIEADEDVPSFDGSHPLKVACVHLA
ncbi:MAG: class I SAM-dependent methyltransferase [Sandaracinaceae bacterium]|nr:class I SAM-dependent methyltransferase [Sandaracinaceae bacterium]